MMSQIPAAQIQFRCLGFFSLWPMKSAFKCWSVCLALTAFDIRTSWKSVCVLPLTSIQLEFFPKILELIACYLLLAMTGQFLIYQRRWSTLDVTAKIFNQFKAKILFLLIEYSVSPSYLGNSIIFCHVSKYIHRVLISSSYVRQNHLCMVRKQRQMTAFWTAFLGSNVAKTSNLIWKWEMHANCFV